MGADLIWCRDESLPDDHGNGAQYEYDPRPPDVHCIRNPPVSKNEFRRYLRTCGASCLWSRLRFMKHRCSRVHKDSHKWMRIPRKRAKFDTLSGNPGEGVYGIEAVYLLSAATVFVTHVTLMLGMVAFSGWWLKRYPGDLQGAFVPLVTTLAIIASFWTLPGRGPHL